MSPRPALRDFPPDSLPSILEPFLWLVTVSTDDIRGLGSGFRLDRVQGIVRGPETVGDSGADIGKLVGEDHQRFLDGIARACRETEYRQAEDTIAAAQAAGYRLAGPSEISMSVRVGRDRETGLEVPRYECTVDLSFLVPGAGQA